MYQSTAKHLNLYYYSIMVLALVSAVASYLLITRDIVNYINPMSALGQVIQYIVIFDALICIPSGLYLFKRKCDQVRNNKDEQYKLRIYRHWGSIRILMVSHPMIPAIVAFYLMGAYQSMLWVAAIAAIGWYFTKPTAAKIEIELQEKTEN